MRYKNDKNIKFVITRFVFFKLKMHQNLFSAGTPPGLRPDPDGELTTLPPGPLVGWGGGYPLPIPLPTRRLGRLELGSQAPATHNPGYATVLHLINSNCTPIYTALWPTEALLIFMHNMQLKYETRRHSVEIDKKSEAAQP